MAEIVGGIGWFLFGLFAWFAWYWRRLHTSALVWAKSEEQRGDEWKSSFQTENLRASKLNDELNSLKEAIRERAKQPVIPVENERRVRKGSWADIRKANQSAILREQEISDKKDADTAFEE